MACGNDESILLRLPLQIRLIIYERLVGTECRKITIGNQWQPQDFESRPIRRSTYNVQSRNFQRTLHKTTYGFKGQCCFDARIMMVNRQLYHELANHLYGQHDFCFGSDLEAVIPFLQDISTMSLQSLRSVTVHKARPFPCPWDDILWRTMCQFLGSVSKLRHLRIVLQGGRPRDTWDGPQQLSVSDFRLLYATRNECLQWARDITAARAAVEELEIVADMKPMAEPTTSDALIFAAFSASIETTLVEFMCTELGMPVRSGIA